jgi:hypothetical protein
MSLADALETTLGFMEQTRFAAESRAHEFASIDTYCMFIGYPRSGHSLIGSLLDAHPNMVVAHEVDALRCMSVGFDGQMIYHTIVEGAREFTEAGRTWNGYVYNVPNQWHGRYNELRVIGDKKGGASSLYLLQRPELLDRLRALVPVPMRFVHVMRNPFDNISTISRLHEISLEEAIEGYFSMVRSVAQVKEKVGVDAVFDLYSEDFIANPKPLLRELCAFLGQSCDEQYLDDCASIVFDKPKKTRTDANWTPSLISRVEEQIALAPILQRYRFDH